MSAERARRDFFERETRAHDTHDRQVAVVIDEVVSTGEFEQERTARLKAVLDARARCRIGDTRHADNPCPACGHERLERLEEIAPAGGQTWVLMCVTQGCVRGGAAPATVRGWSEQAKGGRRC